MVLLAHRITEAQINHPPRAIGCLNEIGMTRSLQYARHRVSAFLRQDGIGGIAGVRSIDIATAGNVHLMPHLCATFGNEQVVIAILLVNMRTLGTAVAIAIPHIPRRTLELEGLGVDFNQGNMVHRTPTQIHTTIFPKQRGVDAVHTIDEHRVAPRTSGIVGSHDEIACLALIQQVDIGGNHVELALMVTDGRGKDTAAGSTTTQIHLRGSIQHIAYLLPMNQVFAVEHRHSREILERAAHQIEVIPHPANARIRIITWNHGILETLLCNLCILHVRLAKHRHRQCHSQDS